MVFKINLNIKGIIDLVTAQTNRVEFEVESKKTVTTKDSFVSNDLDELKRKILDLKYSKDDNKRNKILEELDKIVSQKESSLPKKIIVNLLEILQKENENDTIKEKILAILGKIGRASCRERV